MKQLKHDLPIKLHAGGVLIEGRQQELNITEDVSGILFDVFPLKIKHSVGIPRTIVNVALKFLKDGHRHGEDLVYVLMMPLVPELIKVVQLWTQGPWRGHQCPITTWWCTGDMMYVIGGPGEVGPLNDL